MRKLFYLQCLLYLLVIDFRSGAFHKFSNKLLGLEP